MTPMHSLYIYDSSYCHPQQTTHTAFALSTHHMEQPAIIISHHPKSQFPRCTVSCSLALYSIYPKIVGLTWQRFPISRKTCSFSSGLRSTEPRCSFALPDFISSGSLWSAAAGCCCSLGQVMGCRDDESVAALA